ncbi:hypothetical protein Zmor_013307 [Zophobas morio]|uniref:CRAL-TRIO domain-containing protein n=2 Tax=Zophobas morio TaxID=2755281 RepID=A0AA38ID85_9CUCU|nr:hypothetical protein Zmor_013303 [Zophobas morio]KAJ3654094.1 hypothetical protein Zmor_013307 [Zophobas morio]
MPKDTELFSVQSNALSSILKVYDKTEESLAEDVLNLKDWMKGQHHLPEILTENMNPRCSNIKEVDKLIYHVPLPKMTKDMYRVFLQKYRIKDKVGQIDPYDLLKMAYNLHEIRLKEDVMCGDVIIFDLKGTSMRLLSKLTPAFLVTFITLYKKIFSLPLKGLYIINIVPYVSTLLSVFKTLVKPKLFARVHVCNDANILKEHFPLEMLPRDYGGTEKSIEELHELCHLKYQEYQDRFDLLDKLRVDESLRPAILENENTNFWDIMAILES